MNEYIFNSTLITSGDKVLNEDIFGTFYKSHKLLKVIDIIDKNTNCLLEKQALNKKFNINLNYVQFLILKNAVPAKWLKKIKTSCSKFEERTTDVICIKLREKITDICKAQAKDIYTELVNKKVKPPSSINTWINLFPFLE